MASPVINSNVGVNVNPTGMEAAARKVQDQVRKIATEIEKAGQAANAQIKAMAIGLKQVDTLQNFKAKDTLGGFGSAQTLGRQSRALAEYRQGISKTSDAYGVLRGRMVALDVANGKLLQSGRTAPKDSLMKAENIERSAQAFGKMNNQVTGLRGRIALMGVDSQKAFAPMLKNLEDLDAKNAKLFRNDSRSSFGRQEDQFRKQVTSLAQKVKLEEKSILNSQKKLDSLRQEAQQITTNTQLARQAELAKRVRGSNRDINNANLVGGNLGYQRQTDQVRRLERATKLAARTQNALNIEMAKPNPGAARLQVLIDRYRQLQTEMGKAIALKGREDAGEGNKTGGFFGGLKSAGGILQSEGGGAYGAGALVGRVGAYAIAAGAIYSVISAFREGITFAIQFEDALAQLQAVSGSTGTEMDRLSEGILKVSKNSANSVMELTKSATIIAQAGYAGSEIEGLLENVVNLSAASGSSTDESVDILTSALGSFQLAASEATQVTDALVAALNDSKLSVNQVQLGLQYVGATARLNNITFNELVATLGAMADAGIRSGSTMSTGLRQMLVDFLDPSKKLIAQLERVGLTTSDIDVKVLGLTEVLTRLRDSGFQAYGALETRAAAAYAVLSGNINQINKLEQATLRQNAAQNAAADRLDSVNAKWQIMLNTFSELGAQIGNNLSPLLKVLIDLLTIVGTIIGGVLSAFSSLATVFGTVKTDGEAAGYSIEQFNEALIAQGLSAEEAARITAEYGKTTDDLTTSVKDTAAELDSLKTTEASLRAETEKLVLRKEDLADKTGEVEAQVGILTSRFPNLRSEFKKTEGGIAGLIQAMLNLDFQTRKTMASVAQAIAGKRALEVDSFVDRKKELTSGFSGRARHGGGRGGGLYDKIPGEDKFVRLMSAGNLRSATELLATNPKLRAAYPDAARQAFAVVTGYDAARIARDNAKAEADQYSYSVSGEGRQILETSTRQSAESERIASQGNYEGKSRAQMDKELQQTRVELLQLQTDYAGDSSKLAIIGSALAFNSASTARLTPEEAEGKKKSGGGRRGGRRTSAERARDKLNRDYERNQARIEKEETEYQKNLFENTLSVFENAPDLSDLPSVLTDIDINLSRWLDSEKALAVQTILDATNGTDKRFAAQRDKMLEAATRNAEQLRIEQVDKIADVFAKVVKNYIDTVSKGIEDQFVEATRFTERNLKIAEARVEGLSNPVGTNNVPEYLRTIKQREADVASVRNDSAQIAANDRRIQQYEDLLEKVREEKEEIERQIGSLGISAAQAETAEGFILVTAKLDRENVKLRGLDEEIQKIEQSTEGLTIANQALRASYSVLNEVPTTFGDGMKMALEAVKLDIGAADSLGQDLIKNLDTPIRAVHESFKGFFSDIISGTVSMGQAFKNMAASIIDSILEMVAVALANQFFSLLAGVIGGAATGSTSDWGSLGRGSGVSLWNGGEVPKAKPMYNGGAIAGGLPTRDSTLVHAAQGEYMLRRPAAMSLGKGFLDAINARGANALKDMGQNVINMPQSNTPPVNVYVVAPEEKPSMGPNDVLATFSNDVLKGGVTKKLIKQVARNG